MGSFSKECALFQADPLPAPVQMRAVSHALARTGVPQSRLMTGVDAFVPVSAPARAAPAADGDRNLYICAVGITAVSRAVVGPSS